MAGCERLNEVQNYYGRNIRASILNIIFWKWLEQFEYVWDLLDRTSKLAGLNRAEYYGHLPAFDWSVAIKVVLLLVERCSCELFTLVLTDMSCIVFLCPDVNKMSKSNQLELSIFGKWRITCLKKVNSFLFASNSALKYLVLCFGWWGCSNKVKVIQLKICVHLTKFTYGHLGKTSKKNQ